MRSAKFAVATPATREASKIGLPPKFGHAEKSEVGHTEKSKFGCLALGMAIDMELEKSK